VPGAATSMAEWIRWLGEVRGVTGSYTKAYIAEIRRR